jgi:hypothetical protein
MDLAKRGTKADVDLIMKELHPDMTLADSKFIDYALGLTEFEEGIATIKEYLFNGTQIQRNYCTLFFNRRGDWATVKLAFQMGLIDEIQAYSK